MDRMMGERIDDATGSIIYKGTIPQIVGLGGLKVKFMVRSGETRPSALAKFNGQVLGLPWHPGEDTINMHLGVNLSTKKQKVRSGKELTLETIGIIDNVPLTRRIMASQIYALYDPLGLLSPITIRYKLLLQQLVQSGLDWEAPLTPDLEKAAKVTLREIVRAQDVVFHRSMVPEGAQGKPELVCY